MAYRTATRTHRVSSSRIPQLDVPWSRGHFRAKRDILASMEGENRFLPPHCGKDLSKFPHGVRDQGRNGRGIEVGVRGRRLKARDHCWVFEGRLGQIFGIIDDGMVENGVRPVRVDDFLLPTVMLIGERPPGWGDFGDRIVAVDVPGMPFGFEL